MSTWGFSIQEARVIDLDSNDRSVADFVQKNEPSYSLCIACGACTATCSAGNLCDFNIRKTHMLVKRGEIKSLEKEINKCMLCGKCLLVCPRGVNLRHVILLIKEALQNKD